MSFCSLPLSFFIVNIATARLTATFHYHSPAVRQGDCISMPAYLGLFIDSISIHFKHIYCILHVPTSQDIHLINYTLKANNVSLISIYSKDCIPLRYVRFIPFLPTLFSLYRKSDFLLLRASTPLLPLISLFWKKPIVLLIVSSAHKGISKLSQPNWRKYLIQLWANWYASQERMVAKKSLTIVNSTMLLKDFMPVSDNLSLIQTTTISKQSFYYRDDTCTSSKIRMIYAGRITQNKGILDIISSLYYLRSEGFDINLALAGDIDQRSRFYSILQEHTCKLNMLDHIEYLGYLCPTTSLLDEYIKSDIFVIASQSSAEGFPRSIWEAMAACLPVVATSVASIPSFAGEAAQLAEPSNVPDLISKIKLVITNPEIRRNMINNGLKLAENNTLSARSHQLSDKIYSYLSK